ncbi:MAG: ATP-binding protein [Desulfurococcales archaeon]|nr:ATP-binding protein [Desulfurococcales archaeon]
MTGRLPLLLETAISRRLFTFIYGPPGSGKTILASHVAEAASTTGFKVSYVYVGSQNAPRTYTPKVASVEALTLDDLVEKVAASCLSGDYVVVDAINELYTEQASRGAFRLLSFIASILRRCGGFATGVVREVEGELRTPGWEALILYAHVVATSSKSRGRFKLSFSKPEKRVAYFTFDGRGLSWL